MKKSKGRPHHEMHSPHGALVHPSFPPQGAPQAAAMGSQSAPPMQSGDPAMSMGMPQGMATSGEEPGAYGNM